MIWIFAVFVFMILCIIIYFNVPYSRIQSEFNSKVSYSISNNHSMHGLFTNNDIKNLPLPVRKYYEHCGFIGKPKMSYMRGEFENVIFSTSPTNPKMKITYTQYNFVNEPIRLAFIDSSLYGIPFQGLDSYIAGEGAMKGVVAKEFTLFDVKGNEINKSSLVTFLSESLIIPNVALQEYITWEEIDDTHAKATISYCDISASGVFTFNEEGEMISFTSDDRMYTNPDGTFQSAKWSAIFGNYELASGIKYPSSFQAVWHFTDGDFIYFDSNNTKIEYFE